MSASPAACVTIALNGGWSNWSVWPAAPGDQAQLRAERQLRRTAWRRASMVDEDCAPSSPVKVAVSVRGSQPVGLRKKPGPIDGDLDSPQRQRHALEHRRDVGGQRCRRRCRTRAGRRGSGSRPDRGRSGRPWRARRSRAWPRRRAARPRRGTAHPAPSAGCRRKPTVLLIVPIWCESGQLPACAWASGHCGTAARLPTAPAGSESLMFLMFCVAVGREKHDLRDRVGAGLVRECRSAASTTGLNGRGSVPAGRGDRRRAGCCVLPFQPDQRSRPPLCGSRSRRVREDRAAAAAQVQVEPGERHLGLVHEDVAGPGRSRRNRHVADQLDRAGPRPRSAGRASTACSAWCGRPGPPVDGAEEHLAAERTSSTGLVTLTVPICEPSGQSAGSLFSCLPGRRVDAELVEGAGLEPDAAAGESARPSGSVMSASLRRPARSGRRV